MAHVFYSKLTDLDARIIAYVRYSWTSGEDIAKDIPGSSAILEQLWFHGYLQRMWDYYRADNLGLIFLDGGIIV